MVIRMSSFFAALFKKNKLEKTHNDIAMPQVDADAADANVIINQYRYIKELSKMKYDAEIKREQNLIQQSSQMQTAFSFISAAVFMAIPICIENRGNLSLTFFLVASSCICFFLLLSLVFASIAQWRWKAGTLPDIQDLRSSIVDNADWEKLSKEEHQLVQWVDLVSEVQSEKARLNSYRVCLIIASMVCFYLAITSIVCAYIIGLFLLF